ncbi:DnaD domain protein [[Mycoplasma] mobile]|uniref:Putative dnaB-like protein n=1 Tax=Mycoplasma mobile (strain ATCC 43663 / 163K / NCTC 11711) TaxID=267748 RepID=Q6KIA5_MYCM1|nr:DnaD domain protein [[Mycoplasma] mobile]AAT27671.1 putative dnaB-like protein [Mycoplasma mobile 163K]
MTNLFIEKNFEISDSDYKIIRKLYQPIIGIKAIALLSNFYDQVENKKTTDLIEVENFYKILNIDFEEFLDLRKKLESFCLIKTFEKKQDKSTHLISLIKPLYEFQFDKNVIYKKSLIKAIGLDLYKKMINLEVENNEDNIKEYFDISETYINYIGSDFFLQNQKNDFFFENSKTIHFEGPSVEDSKNLLENEFIHTNEIPIVKAKNILEAINEYSTTQFIKYIWNNSATIEMTLWISEANKNGFSDDVLNLVINSCVDIIGYFNFQYIKTVANNLLKQNKISYQNVLKHFSSIKKLQKKSKEDFLNSVQVKNNFLKNTQKEYTIFDFQNNDDISFEDLFKYKKWEVEDSND